MARQAVRALHPDAVATERESAPVQLSDVQLIDEGTDLLFAPPVEVMYPKPQADQTRVEVPGLSELLCGAHRPGHFVGVATVVCKLFNMVQPDIAVFGKKDFQQLMVIRRMVEDLAMPVRIEGGATLREADGLAMSSRNGYLTEAERSTAPILNRMLSGVAAQLRGGSDDFAGLQAQGPLAVRRVRRDAEHGPALAELLAEVRVGAEQHRGLHARVAVAKDTGFGIDRGEEGGRVLLGRCPFIEKVRHRGEDFFGRLRFTAGFSNSL